MELKIPKPCQCKFCFNKLASGTCVQATRAPEEENEGIRFQFNCSICGAKLVLLDTPTGWEAAGALMEWSEVTHESPANGNNLATLDSTSSSSSAIIEFGEPHLIKYTRADRDMARADRARTHMRKTRHALQGKLTGVQARNSLIAPCERSTPTTRVALVPAALGLHGPPSPASPMTSVVRKPKRRKRHNMHDEVSS